MMRTLGPALGVALAMTLALTACSAPDEAAETPVPGACLADYNGADSDRTSLVPCTEEHVFDVVGVATWPEMSSRIAASSAGDVFDDIQGPQSTELKGAYWEWAYWECNAALRTAVGMADIVIQGVTTHDMDMVPGDLFIVDPSLASRDAFMAGDTSTVCSLKWTDQDKNDVALAYPRGITVLDLMSAEFPTDRRACFLRPDAGDYSLVACSEPHSGQYLVYFDGVESIGPRYLETLDPRSRLFADYGPLDAYCETVLEAVYPGVLDSPDWVVWSDALGDQLGWADFDGTVDPDSTYPLYCGIYGGNGGAIRGDALASRG